MSALNVLIAVRYQIFRDGLRRILEEESDLIIQDTYDSIEDLIDNPPTNGGVLLLDVDMLEHDADRYIEKLLDKNPDLDILVISRKDKTKEIKDFMQAGISGFMFKERDSEELKKALHEIGRGERYICDDALHLLLKNSENAKYEAAASDLTEREVQILGLICKELTNREIADKLNISARTVDAHRRNILQKTGAKNTAGLVKYAIRHNIYEF